MTKVIIRQQRKTVLLLEYSIRYSTAYWSSKKLDSHTLHKSRHWTCDSKGRRFESRTFRFQVTTLGKLFTHVPLSPSSIIWYLSRGGDALWLGRSGVALAMHHRLQ